MKRPLIALTGSTGFIGQAVLTGLSRRGMNVRVLLRRPMAVPEAASSAVIGDIAAPQNMAAALRDVDAVVHSAGIAHAMSGFPEDDYRAINTEATIALAHAAERAGVKRFVFLSSIRAQCGPSAPHVLNEDSEARPTDAYGRSKLEAEQGLASLSMDWVALRPVLVYGPGVKGNLAALLRLARAPWPLPLGALVGRRSLIGLEDLVAAIALVLETEGPLRRPLIVAHPEPLTVGEMVRALRHGLDRRAGLLPVPEALVSAAARLSGRGELVERLAGSLVADPTRLMALGWQPALAARDGLAQLARASASGA
jgi:nucleoside-diphosphate-sugar epimerase